MLVKISTPEASHMELSALLEVYEARIVDVSMGSMMIEATGSNERLDALEIQLKKFRIQELCRTGRIALESGSQTIISAAD
jgi:acetolactate synthase-1/3 small subunit